MTDLEKIETYKEFNKQITEKQEEKSAREKSFKAYLAKLTKDFDESQEKLAKDIEEIKNQKNDYVNKEHIIINFANFIEELSKVLDEEPKYQLMLSLYQNEFNNNDIDDNKNLYTNQNRFLCELTLKLKTDYQYNFCGFRFFNVYIQLLNRDEIHKDNVSLKIFWRDSRSTYEIKYDLDKILVELPLYLMEEYDEINQVVTNCLKKQELKSKTKLLKNGINPERSNNHD